MAYVHEAAHALAVAEAGWEVTSIEAHADGSGHTAFLCPPLSIDSALDTERDLLISLVGGEASARWHCVTRAGTDVTDVSPGDDADAEDMIYRLARLRGVSHFAVAETERRRARAWIEDHIEAIGCLAQTLQWADGCLVGRECEQAIAAALAGRTWHRGPIVRLPARNLAAAFPAETSPLPAAFTEALGREPDGADMWEGRHVAAMAGARGLAFAAIVAGGRARRRRFDSVGSMVAAMGRRHAWRAL